MNRMNRMNRIVAGAAIAVAVILASLFGFTAHNRTLTGLESFVLQLLSVVIGLVGPSSLVFRVPKSAFETA